MKVAVITRDSVPEKNDNDTPNECHDNILQGNGIGTLIHVIFVKISRFHLVV